MPTNDRSSRRSLLSATGSGVVAALAGCGAFRSDDPLSTDWEARFPLIPSSVTHTDGSLFLSTDGGLYVYDIDTGDEKGFNIHMKDSIFGEPVAADGLAFYGTNSENTVYAVDETGTVEWETQLPGSVTSCALGEGIVYAASGAYRQEPGLYALDIESGDEVWSAELDEFGIASSPTVAHGRVYIESSGLAAFDAETGDLDWRTERGETNRASAAQYRPAVDESRAYYSHSLESGLFGLDAESGDEHWHVGTNERLSTPVVRNGTVYAGTVDSGNIYATAGTSRDDSGTVYAVAAGNGEERWTAETGPIAPFGPTVREETVYAAATETLYAIDRGSGEIEWEHGFDRPVSHPIVVEDRIFITGYARGRGKLFALSID